MLGAGRRATLVRMISLAIVGADVSKAAVADLMWMSGDWTCEIWGGTFEEHWSVPNAGSMVGAGKHVKDGKTTFMEFLSIEQGEGGPVMWILLGSPSKGEKKGMPFELISLKDGVATFENKANEFPSQIVYRKTDDGMTCRIQGIQDGKASHDDFDFKRM